MTSLPSSLSALRSISSASPFIIGNCERVQDTETYCSSHAAWCSRCGEWLPQSRAWNIATDQRKSNSVYVLLLLWLSPSLSPAELHCTVCPATNGSQCHVHDHAQLVQSSRAREGRLAGFFQQADTRFKNDKVWVPECTTPAIIEATPGQ